MCLMTAHYYTFSDPYKSINKAIYDFKSILTFLFPRV